LSGFSLKNDENSCLLHAEMQLTPKIVLEANGSFRVTTLPDGRVQIELEQVSGVDTTVHDTIYDKQGVAKRLLTTTRSVDNFMRLKKNPLPYSKASGHPRFRESEIQRWLNEGQSLSARRSKETLETLNPYPENAA
jgi:hypothetical protein